MSMNICTINYCTQQFLIMYRPDNKRESSIHLDARLKVMMRGSLKAKLPPALTISSSNLRVLDPIGQGTCMSA